MMHFIYKWLKQCRFFLRLRIAAEVSSGDPSQSDIQLATPYGGVEEFANWAPTQVAGQNTSRFNEPFLCQARDNDQFTKTGSGQTQETVRNTRACMRFLTDAGRVREAGDSKTVFLRCHLLNKRTFYQDRLGTNIGKALKQESPFFPQVAFPRQLIVAQVRKRVFLQK
jgi:hypothetical protein